MAFLKLKSHHKTCGFQCLFHNTRKIAKGPVPKNYDRRLYTQLVNEALIVIGQGLQSRSSHQSLDVGLKLCVSYNSDEFSIFFTNCVILNGKV